MTRIKIIDLESKVPRKMKVINLDTGKETEVTSEPLKDITKEQIDELIKYFEDLAEYHKENSEHAKTAQSISYYNGLHFAFTKAKVWLENLKEGKLRLQAIKRV